MNSVCVLLSLLLLSAAISAQHAINNAKGAPEILDPSMVYGSDTEVLNKIQSQLLNALEMLQNVQDPGSMPLKLAEKRRNKFEFIRFGRRRR